MKIKIKNKKYTFITDNSAEANADGAFLLTQHNKKYKKKAEENGCAIFLTPDELFSDLNFSDIKIIGITGTNGKTTITNIIAHILKNAGKKVVVSGTEGAYFHTKNGIEKLDGNFRGCPEILETLYLLQQAKERGAEFFVMEATSHGIFQQRIEGLKFSAKIFTNLTQDHLDFHKTMEEYAAVKSSFFTDEESVKIINADDKWIKYNSKNSLTYSLKDKSADFFAENFSFKNGISTDILSGHPKDVLKLKSQMIGKFNLYNILAAVGVVKSLTDLKMSEILEYLVDFSGVAGRMELLYSAEKKGFKMQIFSDYAHTPDAIENVLQSISDENFIITIVGAGGDRDVSKRPIMAKMAVENSDFVYLTSDNPRTEKPGDILSDMERGVGDFKNYEVIVDRKEAIKKALQKATKFLEKKNVVVAILGKGDENYIEIMGEKIDYSDKEEVEKYFKK